MKLFKNTLAACALIAALCAPVFTSCSDDDKVPAPQKFSGDITSSIPVQPDFVPSTSEDDVTVTWKDADQTLCDITVGGFEVTIPQMGRGIVIGDMNITDVKVSGSDGSYTFSKDEFTCQAGDYESTGKLEGALYQGKLSLTVTFKPGSMPFEVQSVFISK